MEKVTRKWADLSNRFRIDVTSWHADGAGFSSPGRCFDSETEWTAHQAAEAAWLALANTIWRVGRRDGVTTDDIQQAIRLLRLTPDA